MPQINQRLRSLLQSSGLSDALEFSVEHPNAIRQDDWSAASVFADEVAERLVFFQQLRSSGLMQTDLHGQHLLDFGCGLAPCALALAPELELAVGVDASFDHCVSAVESLSLTGLDNVGIFWGSLLACSRHRTLPFSANTFDMVVSYHGLNRRDLMVALPDLAGLLRPGGRLYIVYPRFWLSDHQLGVQELELLGLARQHAADWEQVNRETFTNLASLLGLESRYHDRHPSLDSVSSTGVIFVSSGIVPDRAGYAALIGDFTRRWQLEQELCVLQKAE